MHNKNKEKVLAFVSLNIKFHGLQGYAVYKFNYAHGYNVFGFKILM